MTPALYSARSIERSAACKPLPSNNSSGPISSTMSRSTSPSEPNKWFPQSMACGSNAHFRAGAGYSESERRVAKRRVSWECRSSRSIAIRRLPAYTPGEITPPSTRSLARAAAASSLHHEVFPSPRSPDSRYRIDPSKVLEVRFRRIASTFAGADSSITCVSLSNGAFVLTP